MRYSKGLPENTEKRESLMLFHWTVKSEKSETKFSNWEAFSAHLTLFEVKAEKVQKKYLDKGNKYHFQYQDKNYSVSGSKR